MIVPRAATPIHGLLADEERQIVELFDKWGPVDLSHRKLAHRGSYLGRVWVSPSTVDRVLARHGLACEAGNAQQRPRKHRGRSGPSGGPTSCGAGTCPSSSAAWPPVRLRHHRPGLTQMDRHHLWPPRPPGCTVRVLFTKALDAEGLLSDELAARLADLDDQAISDDDPALPLLVAISDNGTEMKCRDTRKFMAVCSIAQHFGRPSTPTDQAWIETLWGHIKSRAPPPDGHRRPGRPGRRARTGPGPLQHRPPP